MVTLVGKTQRDYVNTGALLELGVFQCLKGCYKKAEEGLFKGTCGDRIRENGFTLK